MSARISFLGAGNMASAIARGILASAPDPRICLYDTDKGKYLPFAHTSVKTADTLAEALTCGEFIVLAVKPQHLPALFEQIKETAIPLEGKVIVSIAAGISIGRISDALGELPIVRAMPNTPLIVGAGVTALCPNALVSEDVYREAEAIFSAAGQVIRLEEDRMNKIIAVTSSSPAYVFRFVKAIAEAAKADGFGDLEDETLWKLVCDVVTGSCKLLAESGQSPDALIRMVTSPGGTTEQANRVFEERGFEQIIADAMSACTKKAEAM